MDQPTTRFFFNVSALQLPPMNTSVVAPLPPTKDVPSTVLHPFHSIDVAISRAPLCLCSALWSYDLTAVGRIQTCSVPQSLQRCWLTGVTSQWSSAFFLALDGIGSSIYIYFFSHYLSFKMNKNKNTRKENKQTCTVMQRTAVPDVSLHWNTRLQLFQPPCEVLRICITKETVKKIQLLWSGNGFGRLKIILLLCLMLSHYADSTAAITHKSLIQRRKNIKLN